MKACDGGTSSQFLAVAVPQFVPLIPSGPTVISGSSALSGTNTVPPLFTVWSTPWSKNWPKNVNRLLYGGDKPTSVVTLGMNSVWCAGVQPTGNPSPAPGALGWVVHGAVPSLPCVLTGSPAAATAAGFVSV